MANPTVSHSLINDYLDALGVPHTSGYSEKRVKGMPFKTLFGLSKLLEEYGVKSEGYYLDDKREILEITPPFLANTPLGVTIVMKTTPSSVTYLSQGASETMPLQEFCKAWDGNVMLSFPEAHAQEPDYPLHARIEFLMKAKKWVLAFACAVIFTYLFIINGLYAHLSIIFISVIDIAGLYLTYLLVQKSLKIHNPTADRVCKVLEEGGCDSILQLSASKFFGLFGWSEVGFAYFSVSLFSLLLLPDIWPWLALCNLCCLPFTFWSIWYQKFRAKKWCTLCVCVQGSLWLLFFCYLFGGWLRMAWPLSWNFFILGLTYLAVMLGLNALMPLIEKDSD
jgi:hypothetical protein